MAPGRVRRRVCGGRQTATVDALGPDWPVTGIPESLPGTVTTNVTRTAYDALGRIASTTDALGQTTDHAYDNLGRKVSETAPAPAAGSARPVTRYGYDAVGNRTSVTDPLGNVTTYAYDARDRRTTVTDARGFATVTTFDRVGNQTRRTDRLGRVSTVVRATQIGIRRMIDRPPAAAIGEITPWGVSALGRLLNRHAEPRMPERRIARMRQTP
ncbi:MAG: RHS repeat domain-containing protein [Planctomycetia bacterium]